MSYSNIISAPDFSEDQFHNVLIIDAEWSDVENVVLFCKTTALQFNVYLYQESDNDSGWLEQAAERADVILINTVPNGLSPIKDRLATLAKSYYYGPKNFIVHHQRIVSPVAYFLDLQNESRAHSAATM